MKGRLSSLFFREPRLLVLAIAMVLVAGLSSMMVLPRAEDPRITNRGAGIVTRLPGADAARVEAMVTKPIEDELLSLDEVYSVDSTSRAGVSVVRVEIEDGIGMGGIEAAWSRVRDALADVEGELPPDASRPTFESDDFWAMTLLAGITWEAGTEPSPAVLNRLAEDLEDRLRAIPGTEYTDLFGIASEEILVELDRDAMSGLGLTPREVSLRVRSSDAKVAAGQVRSEGRDLVLEVAGELDTLERLRNINIATGADGSFVRLGDVARISKQAQTPPTRAALIDATPGVVVGARLGPSERVDAWSRSARRIVEEFDGELGTGIGARVIFDQSVYTSDRLSSLVMNFGLGIAAVVCVVFVVMGWRSALLVGASLPLSVAAVLFEMRLLGIPIHQMSVTGLIIALGLLIDNAIVMVDDVTRRRRDGSPPDEAIRGAVAHLAVPLLGSTVTTVLAFAPIALMPGGAGEFVGTIAIGVILALLSSLAISLTIIPALAGRLGVRDGGGFVTDGVRLAAVEPLYRRALGAVLKRPLVGVLGSFVPAVLGYYLVTTLPTQFFPGADRDQFHLHLRLPQGSSIEQTRDAVGAAIGILDGIDGVESASFFLGDSAPLFYYNIGTREDDSPHFAAAMVDLKSAEGARGVIREVQGRLESALPGVKVIAMQLEQGPPFDAPVEVKIFGEDVGVLRTIGEQARRVLSETPGIVATHATLDIGRAQARVELDEQASRLVGLDNRMVAEQLDGALEGAVGGSLIEDTEELPVRVRIAGDERRTLADVSSVDLFGPGGGSAGRAIPLSAVADVELVPEIASLDREDGRRVNRIQGFVRAGELPGRIVPGYMARLSEEIDLPSGYELVVGGESGERGRAVSNLLASVAVLVVLMAGVLILSFNSFRTAGVLAVVAVGAAGYGFLALAGFGYPNGFMAIVGTMGLIGVAINDAIVVLASIRNDAEARCGDVSGIVRVVMVETRHVVATTLTTIAGFTPLLVDGGTFWPPMAVVIAGGVFGATVLGLVAAPCAYAIVFRGLRGRAFSLGRAVPA